MTRLQQDRLIDFAAHHYAHAEARSEGDVALFTELGAAHDSRTHPTMCEIEVCDSFEQLVAALGY